MQSLTRFGRRHGVSKDGTLQRGVRRDRFKIRKRSELRVGEPLTPAHGRPEVNSKRTADRHRDFNLGKPLALQRHRSRRFPPHLHVTVGPQQP